MVVRRPSDEESVIMGDALASVVRCVGSNDTLLLPILSAVVATETCILPQVCSGTEGMDATTYFLIFHFCFCGCVLHMQHAASPFFI